MVEMEGLLDLKEVKKIFLDYSHMADQYYNNMIHAYHEREYRKASELLWGTISQLIKALAILYGKTITQHGEFFQFVKKYSQEMNDEEYYELFLFLHDLHKNFYDRTFPDEDFQIYLKKADKFIIKTRNYIEKRLEELKKVK